MRTFSRTSQFKKDVKLAEKRWKDLSKLRAVLDVLIEGDPLPPQYKDHPLRGNFAGKPGLPYRSGLAAYLHAR